MNLKTVLSLFHLTSFINENQNVCVKTHILFVRLSLKFTFKFSWEAYRYLFPVHVSTPYSASNIIEFILDYPIFLELSGKKIISFTSTSRIVDILKAFSIDIFFGSFSQFIYVVCVMPNFLAMALVEIPFALRHAFRDILNISPPFIQIFWTFIIIIQVIWNCNTFLQKN